MVKLSWTIVLQETAEGLEKWSLLHLGIRNLRNCSFYATQEVGGDDLHKLDIPMFLNGLQV